MRPALDRLIDLLLHGHGRSGRLSTLWPSLHASAPRRPHGCLGPCSGTPRAHAQLAGVLADGQQQEEDGLQSRRALAVGPASRPITPSSIVHSSKSKGFRNADARPRVRQRPSTRRGGTSATCHRRPARPTPSQKPLLRILLSWTTGSTLSSHTCSGSRWSCGEDARNLTSRLTQDI